MSDPRDDSADTPVGEQHSDRDGSTDCTAARLAELERRVTELEATTAALRGYVGGVRAVEGDVERRANAALAAVNRLEAETDGCPDETEIDDESPAREVESDDESPAREVESDDRATDRLRERS
ncbi:MAG: hypothetical protein ABEI99_12170 [Halobaculum sp.]